MSPIPIKVNICVILFLTFQVAGNQFTRRISRVVQPGQVTDNSGVTSASFPGAAELGVPVDNKSMMRRISR